MGWVLVILLCLVQDQVMRAEAPYIPKGTEFRVRLLSSISARRARPGDQVTLQVISPYEFAGAVMKGVIREVETPARPWQVAAVSFTVSALVRGQDHVPIQTEQLKKVVSLQGSTGFDGQGRILETPPGPVIHVMTKGSDLLLEQGSELVFAVVDGR